MKLYKWWRIPWIFRVVIHPDVELDLVDKKGFPDHAKIMGWVAFLVDVVLIWTRHTPPLGHFIVLNSVVFGWIGMRAFLASKTATATETVLVKMESHEGNPGDTKFVD